jgi:threonine/homoserine/homoserine lactone efflux protein
LGLLVLGLIAGLGGATLISETRWLYDTIRWGGVAFLVWLAWDSYREARKPPESGPTDQRFRTYFVRGLVTNLLNPKAAAFYIAVMPNFIAPGRPMIPQALTLALVYVAVATAVHAAIVALGGTLQPILSSTRWRSRLGMLFAVGLVAIAVWLPVTTRRVWER